MLLLLGAVVFALTLSEVALRILVSPQTALWWASGDEDYWQRLWLHGAQLLVVVIPFPTFAWKLDRGERFLADWGSCIGVSVLLLRDTFSARQAADKRAKLYIGH